MVIRKNDVFSSDLIAEEQQRLANSYLLKKDESEIDGDNDEYVPRSRKFNERNLLPQVLVILYHFNLQLPQV